RDPVTPGLVLPWHCLVTGDGRERPRNLGAVTAVGVLVLTDGVAVAFVRHVLLRLQAWRATRGQTVCLHARASRGTQATACPTAGPPRPLSLPRPLPAASTSRVSPSSDRSCGPGSCQRGRAAIPFSRERQDAPHSTRGVRPLLLAAPAAGQLLLDDGHMDRPLAEAVRAQGPVHIDGRLDEPAWALAPVIDGFRQIDPDEGAPVSRRTEVRILFDDDALYIGAR